MANIFCPSCGAKADYQFSAPNFCSKCGKAYMESKIQTFTSQMRSSKVKKRELQQQNDDYDDDYNDSSEDDSENFSSATRVPRIRKLDVDIDSTTDVRVIKFGDLINQNSESNFVKGRNVSLDDLTNKDEF